MLKAIGTSYIDFKQDKYIGLLTKCKLNLTLQGIYNIALQLRGNNPYNFTYKFEIGFLNSFFDGGNLIQKKLTDEEKQRIQLSIPKGVKNFIIQYQDYEPKINWEENSLRDVYHILEDPNLYSSVQFKNEEKDQNQEIIYTNKDVNILENCIFKERGCYVYLICHIDKDEIELKKIINKIKEEDELKYFQPQCFYGWFELDKLLQDDNIQVMNRVVLQSYEQNYFSLQRQMYVKIELKSDVIFSKELKPKFNINTCDIIYNTFFQKSTSEEKINLQFNKIIKELKNYFDEIFFEQKENINQIMKNGKDTDWQNQWEEINQILKTQFLNKTDFQSFEEKFSLLIKDTIINVFSINKFNSINMDEKDNLYNKTLCYLVEMLEKQLFEEKQIYFEKIDQLQDENSNVQKKYLKQLEKITKIKIEEYFLEKSEEYFIIGNEYLAWQSLFFCMQQNQNDKILLEHVLSKLLQNDEFEYAENLVIKIMLLENKNKFNCYKLMIFLLFEQKKIREGYSLVKYCKERYPEHMKEIVLLFQILVQNFDENIFQYLKDRLEFLFQQKKSQNDPINFYFSLFEQKQKEIFDIEILNDQLLKIRKEKKIPKQEQENNENLIDDVKTQIFQFYFEQNQYCLKYNLKKCAEIIQEFSQPYIQNEENLIQYQMISKNNTEWETLVLLDQVINQHPENPELLMEVYEKLFETEYLNEEIEETLFFKMSSNFSKMKKSLKFKFITYQGNILKNQKNLINAKEIYKIGIKCFPYSSYLHFKKSEICYELQEYEESFESIKKANFLDKTNPDYWILLSLILIELNQKEKLIITIRNLKKLNVQDSIYIEKLYEILEENNLNEEMNFFRTQTPQNIDFPKKLFGAILKEKIELKTQLILIYNMNKNQNYLNDKLSELKRSVLNKNQQLTSKYQTPQEPRNDYFIQKPQTYTKKNEINFEKPYTYNVQNIQNKYTTNFTGIEEPKMNYNNEGHRVLIAQDAPNFYSGSKYTSPTQNFLKPKNYNLYESNTKAPKFETFDRNKFSMQQEPQQRFNMEKSILDSVIKQTGIKTENEMYSNLNSRLQEETAFNQKLKSELGQLGGSLEREKQKLEEMDHVLSDELRRAKEKEFEIMQDLEKMELQNQSLNQELKKEEEKQNEYNQHFDNLIRENEMLKSELKRFGEMTSEKILELENGINNINRMKEFEKENFLMEKEKIQNHCEFVLEQIKTQAGEREVKISEELKKTQQERMKVDRDLEQITNELRGFDYEANQKINSIMRTIIEEEGNQQKEKIKNIDDQIRDQEGEINRLNQENQKQIHQFQELDRDFKSRLINLRNRNTRLKEEFSNLEDEHNKLMIRLKSDHKDLYNKNSRQERLNQELDDVIQKSKLLDQNYQEEINHLKDNHEQHLHELENILKNNQEQERELQNQISQESEKLNVLQQKHESIIEELQNKLNNTLQHQQIIFNIKFF